MVGFYVGCIICTIDILRNSVIKYYLFIVVSVFVTIIIWGCFDRSELSSRSSGELTCSIRRYDLLELRYLMTGDYSALQKMKTQYVVETQALIENLLCIGELNDPGINHKLYNFFEDSTLSKILRDVEVEFHEMDNENLMLVSALHRFHDKFPDVIMPEVYSQIGDLGQSIVVSGNLVGVSLDKYLGEDYSVYKRYYSKEQRKQMTREYIVPDCLVIYLISKFPLNDFEHASQYDRDLHIQCIWAVVNGLLQRDFYPKEKLKDLNAFLKKNKKATPEDLLYKMHLGSNS